MDACPTALVSDAHESLDRYQPFQRPPDRVALTTAIPRGLRTFVLPGRALAAKPINDEIMLRINMTLRAGKAYVFNELQLSLVVDTAWTCAFE